VILKNGPQSENTRATQLFHSPTVPINTSAKSDRSNSPSFPLCSLSSLFLSRVRYIHASSEPLRRPPNTMYAPPRAPAAAQATPPPSSSFTPAKFLSQRLLRPAPSALPAAPRPMPPSTPHRCAAARGRAEPRRSTPSVHGDARGRAEPRRPCTDSYVAGRCVHGPPPVFREMQKRGAREKPSAVEMGRRGRRYFLGGGIRKQLETQCFFRGNKTVGPMSSSLFYGMRVEDHLETA
jgi:hypothetical protein